MMLEDAENLSDVESQDDHVNDEVARIWKETDECSYLLLDMKFV
jgi:hypothetical protein